MNYVVIGFLSALIGFGYLAYSHIDDKYESVRSSCVKTDLLYWHGGWENVYDCSNRGK